jgi:hypothetical protein
MSVLMKSVSRRVLNRAAVLGVTLFASSAAWATGNFPPVVRSQLELSTAPSCTLCHQGTPQVGSVTTPFGKAMRARGLVFYDEEALKNALAALRRDNVDSDGDGTPDIEELQAGRDPNRADAATTDGGPAPVVEGPPELTYGCGVAPGGLSLGLLGALSLCFRRRRATP